MTFLPDIDRDYLTAKGLIFEEVEEGAMKGLIIRNWRLPDGRFDAAEADVLLQLPPGYPDVPPDMFYVLPWVKVRATGQYPKAADQPLMFAGQRWQRWSRHNPEWRPGVDGIRTMLQRVEHALRVAA